MSARRLVLVAAALGIAASEYALWVQLRDSLRDQAEIRRQLTEHCCSPRPAVLAPPSLLSERMPDMPYLVDPAPMTDPALEEQS